MSFCFKQASKRAGLTVRCFQPRIFVGERADELWTFLSRKQAGRLYIKDEFFQHRISCRRPFELSGMMDDEL